MVIAEWRKLTTAEKDLLQVLLARINKTEFGEADDHLALPVDEFGSLSLRKSGSSEMGVVDQTRPLISAYFDDEDQREAMGPLVNIILFERGGTLCELQIFRSDGSMPKRPINPAQIFDVELG